MADGTSIGALVVCNAWGDVYRQTDGQIIAGTRDPQSGQLIDSEIVRSSGYAPLDEEALAMLKRASPLPRPPPAVTGEMLELFVPIHFTFQ